jgi:hypothetical protein
VEDDSPSLPLSADACPTRVCSPDGAAAPTPALGGEARAWQEIRLHSFEHFAHLVGKLQVCPPPKSPYVFRGQADHTWGLRPSLLRLQDTRTRAEFVAIETMLLSHFQSQAHLLTPDSIALDPKDITSWWTLMQHHGAPTRLLDWTASAYVAAYFAVCEYPHVDGAIWFFHPDRVHTRTTELGLPSLEDALQPRTGLFTRPNEERHILVLERKTKIQRMVTQQAGFTLASDVLADHADLLGSLLVTDSKNVWRGKLIIPALKKIEFLSKLHRANVTGLSLFPGIDGLGRTLRDLAIMNAQPLHSTHT